VGRFACAVSLVAIWFLVAVWATAAPHQASLAAQGSPAANAARHPLVGSWVFRGGGDAADDPPILYTFNVDGTLTGSSAAGGRHGVWEATGERTALVTFVALTGAGPGDAPLQVRGDIEMTSDTTVTFTYTYEVLESAGPNAAPQGPFTENGTRITVETMATPSRATPVAGGTEAVGVEPTVEAAAEMAVDAVHAQAVSDLGVDASEITLLEVSAEEFPDSALGCPDAGAFYAQVITPGYRVVLKAADQTVEYHTSTVADVVVRCGDLP